MIEPETIKLIAATNPAHGIDKAIEIFLKVAEEKTNRKTLKPTITKYIDRFEKKQHEQEHRHTFY